MPHDVLINVDPEMGVVSSDANSIATSPTNIDEYFTEALMIIFIQHIE
jgi:hypothetical protein